MWKKILVAVLVVTVAAAGVMAVIEVQGNAAAETQETAATQDAAAPRSATPTNGAGNAGRGKQQGQNASSGTAKTEPVGRECW